MDSSAADRVYGQLVLFSRRYAERDDEFTSPLIRTIKRHRTGSGARPMTDDESGSSGMRASTRASQE